MKKILALIVGLTLIAAACNKQVVPTNATPFNETIKPASVAPSPKSTGKQTAPKNDKVSVNSAPNIVSPEEQQNQIDQSTIKNIEQDQQLQDHENRINNLENNMPKNDPTPSLVETPLPTPSPVEEPPIELATLSFGAAGPSASNIAVVTDGSAALPRISEAKTDLVMWESLATIGIRDVVLKSIKLRKSGSTQNDQIGNLRLYANDTLIGTVDAIDNDGYISFDSNLILNQGSTDFKLVGDINTGGLINRNFIWALSSVSNVVVKDSQYDQTVIPFGSFSISSGLQTIISQ